jgi:hypothetical protein
MHPSSVSQETPGFPEVLDRFEDAWQSGRPPVLDDYLPAGGTGRRELLIHLVHVDLEYRLKAGEAARVEDYLGRYAELGNDSAVLLGLLAAEYGQRRRREPELSVEEYARRFPKYREALPQVLTVSDNRALAETLPAPSLPAAAAVPRRPAVPGYEVIGELGRGGMGVVYQARQVKLQRLVALKMILSGGHASKGELDRLRAEAEAIARLQHPNIVAIHEVGEHEGMPFLALEFCAGGSLEKKLSGTPLPPAEAASLMEALSRAMDAAHRAQVIHRDLKPANVLLSADGQPKVTDFGLAKRLDGDKGPTRTGDILGTPSYMAPEQAEGRHRDVGPATDVYALGAILYECLTGRPPFKAATPLDTIVQVVADEPLPPSRLNPRVPRDLETICLHCLEKDPRKRYAGAVDLAEDLGRFRRGEPVAARPAGVLTRAAKWVRRRPALAALVAVSVLAASGLLATVLLYNAQLQAEYEHVKRQRDAAEEATRREAAAHEETQAALLESQRRLTLNYFAYGRLCAVAARLATAQDRAQVEEPLREFHRLQRWLERLGDEAIKPALADYAAALDRWQAGPAPNDLKRSSLALAHACRKPWTDLIDKECPELANQVRGLLYARAVEAADELARANERQAVAQTLQEFWELYWGELYMVESKEVERAMVRLGKAVEQWKSGPSPGEVAQRAEDLRQACRLPATGPRGGRGGNIRVPRGLNP